MKKHFLNLALWALLPMSLCVTGCSDDDTYPDVDGQTPVAEMKPCTSKQQRGVPLPLKAH